MRTIRTSIWDVMCGEEKLQEKSLVVVENGEWHDERD
jgi:hypothetical protein